MYREVYRINELIYTFNLTNTCNKMISETLRSFDLVNARVTLSRQNCGLPSLFRRKTFEIVQRWVGEDPTATSDIAKYNEISTPGMRCDLNVTPGWQAGEAAIICISSEIIYRVDYTTDLRLCPFLSSVYDLLSALEIKRCKIEYT